MSELINFKYGLNEEFNNESFTDLGYYISNYTLECESLTNLSLPEYNQNNLFVNKSLIYLDYPCSPYINKTILGLSYDNSVNFNGFSIGPMPCGSLNFWKYIFLYEQQYDNYVIKGVKTWFIYLTVISAILLTFFIVTIRYMRDGKYIENATKRYKYR